MALSPAQSSALKADIQADGALLALSQAGNIRAIKNAYNAASAGAETCWRSSFSVADAWAVVVKSEYVATTAGVRDAFTMMFLAGSVNPSKQSVRDDFASVFAGAAHAGTRVALVAAASRPCTRAEALFSTGANPRVLPWEGPLGITDIVDALRS